jgi:hypothetical protein
MDLGIIAIYKKDRKIEDVHPILVCLSLSFGCFTISNLLIRHSTWFDKQLLGAFFRSTFQSSLLIYLYASCHKHPVHQVVEDEEEAEEEEVQVGDQDRRPLVNYPLLQKHLSLPRKL